MARKTIKQLTAELAEAKAANALLQAAAIDDIEIEEAQEEQSTQKTGRAAQADADKWLSKQLARLDNVSFFRGTIWFAQKGEAQGRNGTPLYNSKICLMWGKGKSREWRVFNLYDGGKAAKEFKDYQQKSNSTKDNAPEGAGWRQDLILAGEPGGYARFDENQKKHIAVVNTQPAETEYFEWYR